MNEGKEGVMERGPRERGRRRVVTKGGERYKVMMKGWCYGREAGEM